MTAPETTLSPQPLPAHVAINVPSEGTPEETTLRNIIEIITVMAGLKIPMITFHITSSTSEQDINTITTIFTALMHERFLDENQVKISAIGKWYELPEKALGPIKQVISATSDYDRHFVNFCMRYDGQEDIVDAAKITARQVQLGKISPESITKETLKEAMLTSTLLPPSLIICQAPAKSTKGILLWDSPTAIIHFSNKPWNEFGKNAFLESIAFYQQNLYKPTVNPAGINR